MKLAPTSISVLLKVSKARPWRHIRMEVVLAAVGSLVGHRGREALNTDCCC